MYQFHLMIQIIFSYQDQKKLKYQYYHIQQDHYIIN